MEVASLVAGAVHVAAMVLGAAANALALLAFRRRRRRRGALSDRFVVNLLSGALVTALTLPPLALAELVGAGAGASSPSANASARPWGLCAAGEAAAAFAATLPPLAVLLLAGDQALAVLQPLRYRARLDTPRAAGMMLVGWSLALAFGAASALVPAGRASLWRSCRPLSPSDPSDPGGGGGSEGGDSAAPRVALAATGFALLFALPFVVTALIYARISGAARRNSQQAAVAGPAHAPHAAPIAPEQQTLRPRAAIVTTIRSRLSNASALGRRPETRAARVSALVVLLALGCWLPWHAVALWRALASAASGPGSASTGRWADAGSLALLSAAAPLTPALFAFRSRRVRRELRRLLRLHPLSASAPSTHARIPPLQHQPSLQHHQPPPVCRPLLASPSPSPPPVTSPPPASMLLLPPMVAAAADASGTARASFSSAGSTQATTSTDE